MFIYFKYLGHGLAHSGCCVLIIIIIKNIFVGYQGPCKVCLKILPILPDFICIILESPCSPYLDSLSIFGERWPFFLIVTFPDSASSHTTFRSSCHLWFWAFSLRFQEQLWCYNFVTLHLLNCPCLHEKLPCSNIYLIPSEVVPKNSLAWFKNRLFLLISSSSPTFGQMFFTVYQSNRSKDLFKMYHWFCEVSSSKIHSNIPTPISHQSVTKYEQILLLIRFFPFDLVPEVFKPVQWNYLLFYYWTDIGVPERRHKWNGDWLLW